MPANLGDLASRAATRGSVLRALEGLDRAALQTLDGLLVIGRPASLAELSALLGAPPDRALAAALDRLRVAALAWGDDDAITCVPTMRDVAGQFPAGLGPPAAALLPHQPAAALAEIVDRLGGEPTGKAAADAATAIEVLEDPAALRRVVIGLDDEAREVLASTTWAPPVLPVGRPGGRRPRRRASQSTGSVAVAWSSRSAAASASSRARSGCTCAAARSIGTRRSCRRRSSRRPRPRRSSTASGPARRRRSSTTSTACWPAGPPTRRRRCGPAACRSARSSQVAIRLGVEQQDAALVAETAFGAGLIGTSDSAYPVWLPSVEYDRWRARPVADRWVVLARAWLAHDPRTRPDRHPRRARQADRAAGS